MQRILETRLTQLAAELQYAFEAELAARLASEVEAQIGVAIRRAAAEVVPKARAVLAEDLNQCARRLRQAGGLDAILTVLADATATFGGSAAVFRIAAGEARCTVARGVTEEAAAGFTRLAFSLEQAPAFAGAIETRDPVTAMASPNEIPAPLRELAGMAEDHKFLTVPVSGDSGVEAVLFAWNDPEPAAVELLAQVAGAVWDSCRPRAYGSVTSGLVAIAAAAAPREVRPAWDALSPEEQRIHLRAQRAARVLVAELQLHDAGAVQSGREALDLYAALHQPIDAAREYFRHDFMESSPTMVDYLHLELLHTLAHDDAALLGKDYPGPLL